MQPVRDLRHNRRYLLLDLRNGGGLLSHLRLGRHLRGDSDSLRGGRLADRMRGKCSTIFCGYNETREMVKRDNINETDCHSI